MVFARNALACGPGKAWNSIAFMPTWRKVKVGKKNDDLGKSLLKRHPGESRIGPGVRQNDGFWGNPPPKEMLEVLNKGGITPLLKEMFGKS
jgi:hypothetical protein